MRKIANTSCVSQDLLCIFEVTFESKILRQKSNVTVTIEILICSLFPSSIQGVFAMFLSICNAYPRKHVHLRSFVNSATCMPNKLYEALQLKK